MTHTDVSHERTSLRKQVQTVLIAEDRVSLAGSLGLFLIGLAWCLGVGIVLASLFWFLIDGLSWFAWFGIYWLILIPLLIWHEKTTRKDYVVASLSDGSSASDAITDQFKLQTAGISMLLAWGPRQMLDGLAALRGRAGAAQNARFKRAAQAVLELAKHSGGVEIKGIMHPPENMPVFMWALDWLDKHDYIGRSSDGERIWISSIGRKKLTDKGIVVKITAL